MAKQSFIWTALPNGYTKDGKLIRVSAILSPRLDPQGDPNKLGSFFPDWEDWPATLTKANFEIHYGGTTVSVPANQLVGLNRVDTSLGTADSDAWKAIFHDDLPVQKFEYKDLSSKLILSYDAGWLSSAVKDLYGKLAKNANGNSLPSVSDLVDDPDWRHLVSTISQLDRGFMDEKTGLRDVKRQFGQFMQDRFSHNDKMVETFVRFQLFHTPAGTPEYVTHARSDDKRIKAQWLEYSRKDMPKKEDIAKQIDFHQVVASMNSYPTMLRKLGLVIDFVLDPSLFQNAQDALLSVAIKFSPPNTLKISATNDASPGTHTVLSPTKFQAVSKPNPQADDLRIVDGLVDLSPNQYDLLQADVDGAGLKLMNFARSLGRLFADSERIDSVTRFEKELGVPSLRNAGLMLVHHNRESMLKNKFALNKALNTAAGNVFNNSNVQAPSLWAEDVVRGFRIDVWDSVTSKWHSLCQRTATYHLSDAGGEFVVQLEEGIVRMAATKSSDPASNSDILYLHEALVSWAGWSLAAPLPGRAIKRDDSVDKSSAETNMELPPGIEFKTVFKPIAGSLPRLRYGRRYWIRARAADLAGNSLLPQEKDFGPENPKSNSRLYCRYDPLTAPIIALVRPQGSATEKPAEGESAERIAIRSFNDTPLDNAVATTQMARRFAVPAQSSIKDAEYHGKVDSLSGTVDKSRFNMLASQKDRDAKDPNAALQEEAIPSKGPLDTAPVNATYAVYKEGEVLTYLPDPMAEEVAVRIFDYPGVPDTDIITIPLYSTGTSWPDARPFKVQVYENPADKPHYDPGTHTLMVPIPKAIKAKVRLSTRLSRNSLEKMGIWDWLAPADKSKLEKVALEGQHWMLTPWRTIEVVHAVQRPLIAPEISKLVAYRAFTSTSARPQFVATCSLKSTDKLDLLAEWHEPKDDPADMESEKIQADLKHGDVGFSIKVTDPKSYATKLLGHKLGGFAEHMILGDDLISVNMIMHDLAMPKNHEFHDTRYRRIEYWLEGTTKFREYLPSKLLTEMVDGDLKPIEKNIKVTGSRAVTWIPSSAPPPAPNILYVVPTFGWVRNKDDKGNQSSWRQGRGLRIYLNRPWNISGYGEMLAVVLPAASFDGNPDDDPKGHPYKNYVTQWGNDPIWLSPYVSDIAPKRSNFPLARTAPDNLGKWLPKDAPQTEKDQPPGGFRVTSLLPAGAPAFQGTSVEIAPHDVFYDEGRRLWYCDIEIDQTGGAYYPFIRLALARYQPVSIEGAHLSNVVLADFMPLTADRWLNVNQTAADPKKRHIRVYGNSTYSNSSGNAEAKKSPSMSMVNPVTKKARTFAPAKVSPTSVIDVWIERLDKSLGEDFGWERVSDAIIQPTPSAPSSSKSTSRSPALSSRLTAADRAFAGELVKKREFNSLLRNDLVQAVGIIHIFPPLWEGDVTLPSTPDGTQRYRLVVAEFEEYLVDDDLPYDKVPEKKERRLVFVEHIELA
jgi:hypothetical protein